MKRDATRAAIEAGVVVAIATIAIALGVLKPEWIPGTASYRAKKSSQATQQVAASTAAADATVVAQGAAVAAGLSAISTANAEAPASPSRSFIGKEVPYLMSMLPAPDPLALRAANERRLAEMQGKLEESRRLYELAYKRAEELQSERDKAMAARDEALRLRKEADLALEKAAAAEHARTMQLVGAGVLVALVGAAWVWLKFNSLSIPTVGRIAADIRSGVSPIAALDAAVDARLHEKVSRAAKLAMPLDK